MEMIFTGLAPELLVLRTGLALICYLFIGDEPYAVTYAIEKK